MDKVLEKVKDEDNKKKFLKGVNGAAKIFSQQSAGANPEYFQY
jgi:hypothetical protein